MREHVTVVIRDGRVHWDVEILWGLLLGCCARGRRPPNGNSGHGGGVTLQILMPDGVVPAPPLQNQGGAVQGAHRRC